MPRCPRSEARRRVGGGRSRLVRPAVSARALGVATILVVGWLTTTPPSTARASSDPISPLLVARVPNSSTIFVVGSPTCSRPLCLGLYRTSVTATGFAQVALPPVTSSSGSLTGTLEHLVFANARIGFAVMGSSRATTLYATFDGARTWHRRDVTVSGVIESVAATPSALYLEVANCAVTVPYCQNFRVARSNLSAVHWTSTPIPQSRTSAEGSFFGPLAALGLDVWVTETGSRAYVAQSRDSGRTFKLTASPELLSVAGCGLTATSSTTLWAQCPTGMMEGFWFSGSDGRSWTYLSLRVAGTAGSYFDPVSPSLAFLTRGEPSNVLVRITNSAHTITTVGSLGCPNLLALTFVDLDHGLAVCAVSSVTYLETTATGGATWQRATITPS